MYCALCTDMLAVEGAPPPPRNQPPSPSYDAHHSTSVRRERIRSVGGIQNSLARLTPYRRPQTGRRRSPWTVRGERALKSPGGVKG